MRSVYLWTLSPGLAAFGAVLETVSNGLENTSFSNSHGHLNQDNRRNGTPNLSAGDQL